MALHDEIRKDIESGLIPETFCVSDLMLRPDPQLPGRYLVGDCSYAENALRVMPANGSISQDGAEAGDYVQRGREPHFVRLGDGLYRLL